MNDPQTSGAIFLFAQWARHPDHRAGDNIRIDFVDDSILVLGPAILTRGRLQLPIAAAIITSID